MSDMAKELRTKWEFLVALDEEAQALGTEDMTDPARQAEFFMAMQEVRDHSYDLFCILREGGGLSLLEPPKAPKPEPKPRRRVAITAEELLRGMTTSTKSPRPAKPKPATQATVDADARLAQKTLDYLMRGFDEGNLIGAMEIRSEWVHLPKNLLHPLMCSLTAYAKHLQWNGLMDRAGGLFRVLTAIAKDNPFYVHGLAGHHEPFYGSWQEDFHVHARDLQSKINARVSAPKVAATSENLNPEVCLAALGDVVSGSSANAVIGAAATCLEAGVRHDDPRLVKMLIPWVKELQAEPRFKNLRRAIRSYIVNEDLSPIGTSGAPGEDWPFYHLTRGKRCLAVANKANHEASARMIEAFGFSDVEWLSVDPRRVESATESLRSGQYGFVLFTRFRDHASDVLKGTCTEQNIPWIMLNGGYGVSAIKNEIEVMNAGKVA